MTPINSCSFGASNNIPTFKQNQQEAVISVPNVQPKRTSSIISTLIALGSIGVAGVALHKNNMLSKELKAALEKAKNSDDKLKEVLNENENKIKEAVEKALKDLEGKKAGNNHTGGGSHYYGGGSSGHHGGAGRTDRTDVSKFFDEGANEGVKYLDEQEALARKEKKAFERKLKERKDAETLARRKEILETVNEEKEYFDAVERNIDENKMAEAKRQAELAKMREDAKEAFKDYEYNPSMRYTGKSANEGVKYLEEQEKEALRQKHLSDLRMEQWNKEQEAIAYQQKQEMYNKWAKRNSKKIDRNERLADCKAQTKRVQELQEKYSIKKEQEEKKHSIIGFFKNLFRRAA